MTLRPEYSLGHSDFNAFLFASAGKDDNGQQLTVLSVLTRLGLDPWAEAARLVDLPREAAAQALIGLLHQVDRTIADADKIAAGLLDLLPRHPVAPIPAVDRPSPAAPASRRPTARVWLFCLAAAVIWFLFLSYMKADPQLEPGGSDVTQQ